LQSNKKLTGDDLKAAAEKQDWDDSIKALIATPDVLAMMSDKIDWTEKLGDAVVAQQADVMDAVQRLRAKAQTNNKLVSTKEQTVTVQQIDNRQVIAIDPTDPNTMYVPYYDPSVVYGSWPYPEYPPYYWPAPAYIGAGLIATGLAFGAGYALGRWASGGNYWGGGFNWNKNNININRPINGGGGNNFTPRVDHRQNAGNRGGREQGLDFRNNKGQQVLNPGNRGNAGNRGNTGDRGNAGNRGGNRPNAGRGNQRPSAGTRPSGGNRNHAAARPSRGNANRGNAGAGRAANRGSGSATRAHGGGGARAVGGGGPRGGGGGAHRAMGGGGGGARAMGGGGGHRGGGGGGGRAGGGGGRRSDIRLKHDIVLLGYLNNGLGFYRFSYNGSDKAYVGVMAQEVQRADPAAVAEDRDGYLRVDYQKLGLTFETYDRWLRSGGQVPSTKGTMRN
jgi:Protein of unknown function (DUF3300)